jgi:hypothetical protein
MWGSSSFSEASSKCSTDIAGLQVVVVRWEDNGTAVAVWYPTGQVHEPLVSAWSSRREDTPLLEAVAFSGRIKKSP